MSEVLRVEIAVASHRGAVRDGNEDAAGVGGWTLTAAEGETLVLQRDVTAPIDVVVADGLGGHPGGARASRQAVQSYLAVAGASVVDAVLAADDGVHALADSEPGLRGMGTTIVAARLDPDGVLTVVNVGDSRAYRLVDGFLGQLSEDDRPEGDHSGAVTQVLGGKRRVVLEPHVFTTRLGAHDVVLLCSDGVHDVLDAPVIGEALHRSPGEAATRLVQLALADGAPDNVTAIVLAPRAGEQQAAEQTEDADE